eukprot:COSAG02_NODE_816_length_16859_cov_15.645764_14_plen_206_part_00
MDNTTAGEDMGGGTAGLLGFSQKMTQSDENFSVADVASIKQGNGGSAATGVDSSGGSAATEWTAVSTKLRPFLTSDERSDKHQLLLNNCSNKRRSDGARFSRLDELQKFAKLSVLWGYDWKGHSHTRYEERMHVNNQVYGCTYPVSDVIFRNIARAAAGQPLIVSDSIIGTECAAVQPRTLSGSLPYSKLRRHTFAVRSQLDMKR